MKKLVAYVFAVAMLATPVLALAEGVSVEVQPQSNIYFFNDYKDAAGFGVKATAKNVFTNVPQVDLSTGLDYVSTEFRDEDVDFYIIPVEAGYEFWSNEDFDVKAVAGLDAIFSPDAAENTVGVHAGVEGAYKNVFGVENLDAVLGVKYLVASTEFNGNDTELSGPVVTAGAKYRF